MWSLICVLVFRVILYLLYDEKRRFWLSGCIWIIEKKNVFENLYSLFWWFLNKMVKDWGLCFFCFESMECICLKLRLYFFVEVCNWLFLYVVLVYVMGKDESVVCLEVCSLVVLGELCF